MRISFCGGGTDIRDYYEKYGGAVTSTTIDKYMYIIVNERFDGDIRLGYSRTEIVDHVDKIKHPLLKEGMNAAGVTGKVEILSMADIPSKGSGLGGSSSFVVGLLNALHSFKGEFKSVNYLAEKACEIEIDLLKEPIGKQDQYASAFGGLNHIRFNENESVFVEPIICSKETKKKLFGNLMLFYTGMTSEARTVLKGQKENIGKNVEVLKKMKSLAVKSRDALLNNSLNDFGELLHENWELKKRLASNISNRTINDYYENAKKAGAVGGKLCGSGNGGFLLFYVEPENQDSVRDKLKSLREEKFTFEPQGTKIIYVEE
ncbi:MAG: GHMP kinase [Candidatus Diapherotrites archaeon]